MVRQLFDLSVFQTSSPQTIEMLSDRNWNLRCGDLSFPMLALNERIMRENIQTMATYCDRHQVKLSPHGKTTMMPWVFEAQQAAGAWGITAAIPSHCQTYRAFGVSRILLANVLVDPAAIRWVSAELDSDTDFEFFCYVDSIGGINILEETLGESGAKRPLGVLIELGYCDGRTGCRSVEEAVLLAERLSRSPRLELRGASAFEGLLPVATDAGAAAQCTEYLHEMHELVCRLHALGADTAEPLIVTAGGSAYFDIVLDEIGPHRFAFPTQTILRSGCYVSHDSGMYETLSPFDGRARPEEPGELHAALELWATVWSRPEPELAIVGFGRRDAPWDHRLPRAQRVCSRATGKPRELDHADAFEITSLDDQHAYLRVPAGSSLRVGDQVIFGVSHPCGAFDRWPWIAIIDDEHNVIAGARSYF